jgi:hypothetical protein
MTSRRFLEFGGIIAGVILIAFGVGAIYMGIDGRATVRDSLKQEQIFFGNATTDEAVATHAAKWSEEQVLTGEQARAFSLVIRDHALGMNEGLTYAQMGRFLAADDPKNLRGTSDPALALKDEAGSPVPNMARNSWVTATALSSALNMSFMAENLALFGIVVGVALLLAGIGFVILALAVLGGAFAPAAETKPAARKEAVPA